jgi:hypothetical protein
MTMKTKITLAMIIVITAAIFTSAVIMSVTPTPQAYAQDRCVSTQVDTGVKHTLIVCGLTHQQAKTSKDLCQLSDAKCSSSQTGFGSTKNNIKEHGNVPSK